MSDMITGYSVAGVIEADPNNEFVWVKFVACSAAVAAAEQEAGEQAHGHYMDGYKMGYAKGIIEGDSGGRKEGYRSAGTDTNEGRAQLPWARPSLCCYLLFLLAVMTSSYEQAVAEGEREALSKWIDGVAKGRADAAKEVAELDLASCESMIEHISRWAAVNAARGTDSSNEGRNTG